MLCQNIRFNIFIIIKILVDIALRFFKYYFYIIKKEFKDVEANPQNQR